MALVGPTPILFTHYGDAGIRGSEKLLLDLLAHLDPARVRPVVWCNQVEMAEAVRALGCTTYRSEFEFYFDYLCPRFRLSRYRALMCEARGLVRRHAIRVLHSNSAAPCQWLVPVAREARLPLLAHLHARYLRRSRYALLLHHASLVVGVSRQVIEPFIADGLAASRTKVIYNGIDFARLRPKTGADACRPLGIPDGATVISAIGALVELKGQDVLIQALGRLGRGRDIRLLIVGDGPEQPRLERLARELGVRAQVYFFGYCEDIGAIYAASDIFAHASHRDSFGLVLAEAGHFGLPVVATSVGGIPEVVEDGVTGLLVPPGDPEALAAALDRVIDDRDYRDRLGHAGKQRVETLFSVERMVENFHETYDHLDRLPRHRLGWLGAAALMRPYLRLACGWHRPRPIRVATGTAHPQ